MRLTINTRKIFEQGLILIVLVLVFLYDAFTGVFGFFDEFIGLLSFLVLLYYIAVKGRLILLRKEYYIIILFGIIIAIGLCSNLVTYFRGHSTPVVAIFADLVTFSKAFVTYLAIRLLSNKFDSSEVLKGLTKYVQIIFYILLVIICIDLIFGIYPKDSRYGFNSLILFFKHGSRYAFAFSFIFLVLLPKYYYKKIGFLLFILLVGMLSLKVKYFGFVIISLIILFYGKKLTKIPKTYFLWIIGILAFVMMMIFREKIEMYFSFEDLDNAWSRAVVLYYSFIIGFDFFPFGTGFGTFSSYYSGAYYSWVYDLYGISNVYGIKRSYWNFIADQYWPMVLGQFGYFGLFAMFGVVYNYFMLFLTKVKSNLMTTKYYLYLSVLLGLIMLLIDSTSDSIFSQQRAVAMFAYFALVMNSVNYQNESLTNK